MNRSFFDTYTRDLRADDIQRLFTRDTREAYRFFTRHLDLTELDGLPRHRRVARHIRLVFLAFAMKLSPARRVVYGAALLFAVIGLAHLFRGIGFVTVGMPFGFGARVDLPALVFREGTGALLLSLGLMNLLVLLELADRLSLKNDLEIAREIQQAMLPNGLFRAPGVETAGISRPANTVGGDFYDILPLPDGRLVVAVGDVAGKGSPAALLMALLLAILRTLVDEGLEPGELVTRLNAQVSRHAPASRFITLFYGIYTPGAGELVYVNAGHMPPMIVRRSGSCERLAEGGIALGMFERSTYTAGSASLAPGELLAVYSDGVTEAENRAGEPFDEQGLERALTARRDMPVSDLASFVLSTVERHTADVRMADDLTVLLLRRTTDPARAGV
ncbi:MAG: PP2C family protein-serine/threonine phosphatase [Betaproteobacteria bacterium]